MITKDIITTACGGRRKGLSYWGSFVNPSKVRLRVGRRRQEGKRERVTERNNRCIQRHRHRERERIAAERRREERRGGHRRA